MLYVRMLLMMGITLYTSRVVLQVLGIEDFGIYNVVAGIVVLFAFLNNAMISSTQRFLNYELGRKDDKSAAKVFSASLTIHGIICLILILLAETIGLYFLTHYIQIPQERTGTAFLVYQMAVFTTCVNIMRTPYNAAIIAYERMSFFAYISIAEVVLKLLVVYVLLLLVCIDTLQLYSILIAVVSLITAYTYYLFCKKNFSICSYHRTTDRNLYSSLVSFSGWSLFGSIATVGASHGLNVLLNMFFGVVVNAAMGIATQVNAAIYSFVANFQTAFNPQIVKSYAAGEYKAFVRLVMNSSRYSFFLLFILSLPILIWCGDLLSLWLHTVPCHAISFCRLAILYSLLDAIQAPLWISVQATGRIRNYQIIMSILFIAIIPLSYIALRLGAPPESVLAVKVSMNCVIFIVRIEFLHKLYSFPLFRYLKDVVLRCLGIVCLSFPLPIWLQTQSKNIVQISGSLLATVATTLAIIYAFGLHDSERHFLLSKIKNKLKP